MTGTYAILASKAQTRVDTVYSILIESIYILLIYITTQYLRLYITWNSRMTSKLTGWDVEDAELA
jgi:hypothetical protein